MAANKILNVEPAYVPASAGNLLNCALGATTGGVGITLTQPYLIVKRIQLNNKDTVTRTVTLYKGATSGSAGGTEYAFDAVQIPAGTSVVQFMQDRFDSGDFLTGICDSASKVTINISAEIGFS